MLLFGGIIFLGISTKGCVFVKYIIKLIGGYHGGVYGVKGMYDIVPIEKAIEFDDLKIANSRIAYLEEKGYKNCALITK
jgi:hypothetical protein